MRLLRPLGIACALLLALFAGSASAYPMMIRHGYAQCGTCHVDPSGTGLLTPYGRAQKELLLPDLRGKDPEELEPWADRLFGVISAPGWLNAGLTVRGGALRPGSEGDPFVVPILMAADLRGAVELGAFQASVSVGFSPKGARLAALTDREDNNVVSRQHWLGLKLLDGGLRVRAGRTQLPFGLRNPEHVAWVRSATRTDTVSSQQYGLAVAYTAGHLRAEVMGIAGNFLLRMPEFREQGYAGLVEGVLAERLSVGLSSLITRADFDLLDAAPQVVRQAHGLFARWAPSTPLVFLLEANALIRSSEGSFDPLGLATFAQADWEPVQGFHLYVTAETLSRSSRTSYGGWLSGSWFFFAHGELRVDTFFRREAGPAGPQTRVMALAQLHLSL